MLDHETRPWHFFIPLLMVVIGGLFMRFDTWEYIGWAIWFVAAVTLFFLIYTVVKDKERKLVEEAHQHMAEIMKLDAAKTKTTVAIDKTDINGFMSKNFSELKIAPAQLKTFAYGVLVEDKGLTIREWTPLNKGKTFSDGQWRTLIAFLKNPDWEDKRIKFAVPINPNNEKEGYELTAAGRRWLQDILDLPLRIPNPTSATILQSSSIHTTKGAC